jgi:MHS family proline/betaine transporter-like MFS transporter
VKVKMLFGVGLGSSLEWYDFALYGFFAPVFAKQYFPQVNDQINLLQAFSLFAIGFLVRPLGGLVFGKLGDQYGRIRCLKVTPILITIPTVFIAFLPTYDQIGLLAPILLLISRIIQGLFIGGEYAGNMVYMCEASSTKRYFFGSIASCTGSFGILIASSVSSGLYWLFSNDFVESFGWRIAFLASAILGILAYKMRKNIAETMDFEQLKTNNQLSRSPILEALRRQWASCLVALSLLFLHATTFYAVFTFMPSLISTSKDLIPGMALRYISLFLFIRLGVIPLIGLLAQKVGGKNMMRISATLFIFLSYPLFSIISKTETQALWAIVSLGIFAFLTTLNAGTIPGLLTEILPSRTRYTTFSLVFNAGFGIFGGIAPLFLQWIITNTKNTNHAAWYLVISGMVALLGTFFIRVEHKDGSISANI